MGSVSPCTDRALLWLGTVKLNYKVSSPWQLSCQVLPTAPKFSMACHGSGSRSHFPPPSAAQRLSVSRSRSGRCFSIMIPCLCQLASHGSTEDDRCCSHIVSAPCPPPPDIDAFALPADAQTEDQKELKSSFVDERPTVIALVPSSISSHGVGVNALTTGAGSRLSA